MVIRKEFLNHVPSDYSSNADFLYNFYYERYGPNTRYHQRHMFVTSLGAWRLVGRTGRLGNLSACRDHP